MYDVVYFTKNLFRDLFRRLRLNLLMSSDIAEQRALASYLNCGTSSAGVVDVLH